MLICTSGLKTCIVFLSLLVCYKKIMVSKRTDLFINGTYGGIAPILAHYDENKLISGIYTLRSSK